MMKSIYLRAVITLVAIVAVTTTLSAAQFAENAHYKRVSSAFEMAPEESGKIEIIEFFLYSCSHCYVLEPKLKAWVEKHKDEVTFKRIPAVITPSWVNLAKAYYVAEKLEVLDKTHDALFKSIHIDKELYLSEHSLAEFFVKQGVKREVFYQEFNAKDIVEKVSDARVLSVKYDFRGVPAVVINDEFKTAPFYTKNQQQMLEVMDYLVEEINKR